MVIRTQDVYDAFAKAFPKQARGWPSFFGLTTEQRAGFVQVAEMLSDKVGRDLPDIRDAYDEGWAACERATNEFSREEAERAQTKMNELRALEARVTAKLGANLDTEVARLEAVL